MNEAEQRRSQHSETRDVVVRFAHVDAAGIVFYPRYFEMLAQAFPELLPGDPPFELEIEFHKPAPLGTRLALAVEAAEDGNWRISGSSGGKLRFSLEWRSRPERPLALTEHDPAAPAFRAEIMRVDGWAAGPDGRLQLSRYYEHVNAAVEQWFDTELGMPFSRLHGDRAGIPTVTLETRCAALPRLGEEFRIWIRPLRVGARSLRFDSMLVTAARCLLKTSQVIVYIELVQDELRSAPLPDSLRSALVARLAAAGSG